jgi:hypothetical protein
LIVACDLNGFVLFACKIIERERNKNGRSRLGKSDYGTLEAYVNQSLVPVLGRSKLEVPHYIVVMDNKSIHISENVVNFIEAAGAKTLYLPLIVGGRRQLF